MKILAYAGLLSAFLGVACAGTAAAQSVPSPSPSPSASPSAAASLPPEIGRVVTSDRAPEPIGRSSRPTFIVDRTRIENYGDRSVSDALVDVPGISIFSYGGFGALTNYGLRGTNSADTLVMLNGIPLTSASDGLVDLGTLPTLGVTRIEVVESGGATLYGAGAAGGVINLISGAQPQPYARFSAGSFGDRDAAAGASAGGFTASIERHTVDNDYAYPAVRYSLTTAYPAGTRTNADIEQTAVRASYEHDLGAWHLRADAGDDAYHLGVPGSLAFGLTPDARQNQSRGDASLMLQHRGANDTFDVTFSGTAQSLAYIDPANGGESDTFDRRLGVSLKDVRTWTGGDLVAGIDVARESALLLTGYGDPGSSATQAQSAAYAQYGADVSPTSRFTFGLRAEHDAPIGSVIVPSLGGIVSLGSARLSANVGSTFRAPTIIDLYYPGFSNPDLKPERVRNLDATIALPNAGGGVSLGWFARHGTDLIVFDQNFVPQNAGHTSVEGFLFTAATRPFHHIRVGASVTDLYRALDLDTGARLAYTPNTRAALTLDRAFDGGRFAFGARAIVVGRTSAASPGDIAVPDAYTTSDAYLRYRFGPATILTARVRNAGDERYFPINGYPAPGRSYSLEIGTR